MPPPPLHPLDLEAHLVGAKCMECRHLIDLVEGICLAFPERIPKDIMQDRVHHTGPYPGDHGLRFERATCQQWNEL